MWKWNITFEKRPPNIETIKVYNDIFNSPLRSAHCKVIRALFTVKCPHNP
jgi:hypothetical protein